MRAIGSEELFNIISDITNDTSSSIVSDIISCVIRDIVSDRSDIIPPGSSSILIYSTL